MFDVAVECLRDTVLDRITVGLRYLCEMMHGHAIGRGRLYGSFAERAQLCQCCYVHLKRVSILSITEIACESISTVSAWDFDVS